MMHSFFHRFRFEALLGLKVLVSLALLFWLTPPLFPDEAQYWVWSNRLDIGYYSKPPGIAWIHALVGYFLSPTEWSVRFPSLLLSAFAAWYLAKAMRALGALQSSSSRSTWLFVFSPIVLYGSFAATTDVGLLLGWCAILYYLEKPLEKVKDRIPFVFWSMWAMLFKPTVLLLALFAWFRFADIDRRKKSLLLLLGCALGGFFPFLWNLQHDGVTFRHVWTQLFAGNATSTVVQAKFLESIHFKRAFEFFLIQATLFSPWISWRLVQSTKVSLLKGSSALKWHAWLGITILMFTVLGSLRIKFQANWPLVAFPSLFCLLSQSHLSRNMARGHTLAHSCLFIGALLISTGQSRGWSLVSETPKSINLFRSVEGWQTLSQKLPELPWQEGEGFWLADKYQTSSLLSFYGPSQQVYWFNLHGARQNQFSFWPVEERFLGAPARFVCVESCSVEEMESSKNSVIEKLKPFFQEVVAVQVIPLWIYRGKVERSALIIDLKSYLGGRPKDPKSY